MVARAIARALLGGKKKSKATKGKKAPTRRAKKQAKKQARSRAAKKQNRLAQSIKRAPVRWKLSKAERVSVESQLRDQFGPPPKGGTWAQLAERYRSRFEPYLSNDLDSEE